jgi:hypothetical protein
LCKGEEIDDDDDDDKTKGPTITNTVATETKKRNERCAVIRRRPKPL